MRDIILILLSIEDVRKKEISLGLLILWGIIEILKIVLLYETNLLDLLLNILPGLLFLFVGKISKEAIGYGDGMVILLIGASLGIRKCLTVILIAFGLITISAIGMFLFKKVGKKTAIPFVPFLTIGYFLLKI